MIARALMLLMLLSSAYARAQFQIRPEALPEPGLWWEVPYTGRIYQVDVSPGGYAFISVTIPDPANISGPSLSRNIQGALTRTADTQFGTLVSPLYQIENVAVSGTGNTSRTVNTGVGNVTVRFDSLESATVEFPGRPVVKIARAQLIRTEQDKRRLRLQRSYFFSDIFSPDRSLIYLVRRGKLPTDGACDVKPGFVIGERLGVVCGGCTASIQQKLSKLEIHIEDSQAERMQVMEAQDFIPSVPTILCFPNRFCQWRCSDTLRDNFPTFSFSTVPSFCPTAIAPPRNCNVAYEAAEQLGTIRALSVSRFPDFFTGFVLTPN